jgi:hypothetical protein
MSNFFDQIGISPNAGASAGAIEEVERTCGVHFPQDFRDFYRASDGIDVPCNLHPATGKRRRGARLQEVVSILPLEQFAEYSSFHGAGYVPFMDCNDSDPYMLCCRETLNGFIVHLFHDNEPHLQLVCSSFSRFLELIAETYQLIRSVDCETREAIDSLARIPGDYDFETAQRTEKDARIGRKLIQSASRLEDGERGADLTYAAQLFGAGHESELERVLAAGDEYVREAVLRRCRCLNSAAARKILKKDSEDFERFVNELADRFTVAGLKVRRYPPNSHNLIVGRNVGVNVLAFYSNRGDSTLFDRFVAEHARR